MERYKRKFKEASSYIFNKDLINKDSIKKILHRLNLNGYEFKWFKDGLYHFVKGDNQTGFIEIVCSQEQLFNGDIEYMTKKDLSLDSNRQRQEIQKFKKQI